MAVIHAWFSQQAALRNGSEVFRKPDGSTVNVTRVDASQQEKGLFKHDEKYVGAVVRAEDGGRVASTSRARGIGE